MARTLVELRDVEQPEWPAVGATLSATSVDVSVLPVDQADAEPTPSPASHGGIGARSPVATRPANRPQPRSVRVVTAIQDCEGALDADAIYLLRLTGDGPDGSSQCVLRFTPPRGN